MAGGIAIMIGLSPVSPFHGGTPSGATYYILAENSDILECENGDLLITQQN